MRPGYGRTFVQVLDETLAASAAHARTTPPAAPPWGGVQTAPLYAGAFTSPAATAAARGWRPEVQPPAIADVPPVHPVTPPPVPTAAPRRARRLTPRQQDALARLVELGATLTPDFTETELRRASRALAQRFHPDRHPGAGPHELARLTQLFGEARAACADLASALAAD